VYCHFLFHFVVNHGTSSPILGASATPALVLTRFLVASLLIGGLSCTTTIRSDVYIVLVCDNKDQTSLEVNNSSINVNFVSFEVRSSSHVAFVTLERQLNTFQVKLCVIDTEDGYFFENFGTMLLMNMTVVHRNEAEHNVRRSITRNDNGKRVSLVGCAKKSLPIWCASGLLCSGDVCEFLVLGCDFTNIANHSFRYRVIIV
jgi:hypothetical protein